MSDKIKNFIEEIDKLRQDLNKYSKPKSGGRLNSQIRRNELRNLAEKYFGSIRQDFLLPQDQNSDILEIDQGMQELVSLYHKRGAIKKYLRILRKCREKLIALDTQLITKNANLPLVHTNTPNDKDKRIIDTLEKMLPSAANSYHQALIDLIQPSRFSWRGPATDLRETLREVLDSLAPDDQVKEEVGFKLEPNQPKPTMKQKVRYILKIRNLPKSQIGTTESAVDVIENSFGAFVRSIYNRSSVSTHTETSKDEVYRIKDLVAVALSELLEIGTH